MTIHTGREIGGDITDMEGPTEEDPPGTNRDTGTGEGWQGGANRRGTRKRKQACGAGRRDKQRRLAGGRWGQSLGGQ